MGKITKERPHGFRTETEAWGVDTGKLEVIEKLINNKLTNEDNYFILFCILEDVSGRTSLGSRDIYIERMKECKKLKDKLEENKNGN